MWLNTPSLAIRRNPSYLHRYPGAASPTGARAGLPSADGFYDSGSSNGRRPSRYHVYTCFAATWASLRRSLCPMKRSTKPAVKKLRPPYASHESAGWGHGRRGSSQQEATWVANRLYAASMREGQDGWGQSEAATTCSAP